MSRDKLKLKLLPEKLESVSPLKAMISSLADGVVPYSLYIAQYDQMKAYFDNAIEVGGNMRGNTITWPFDNDFTEEGCSHKALLIGVEETCAKV